MWQFDASSLCIVSQGSTLRMSCKKLVTFLITVQLEKGNCHANWGTYIVLHWLMGQFAFQFAAKD